MTPAVHRRTRGRGDTRRRGPRAARLTRRAAAAVLDCALLTATFGPWDSRAPDDPTEEELAEATRRAEVGGSGPLDAVALVWRSARDTLDTPSPRRSWPARFVGWAFMAVRPVLTATAGGTPGQRLLGLRVVGPDGRPVGFARAILRDLLLSALGSALPWLLPIRRSTGCAAGMAVWALDLLWPLIDRQRRSLRDVAVGTRVVRG